MTSSSFPSPVRGSGSLDWGARGWGSPHPGAMGELLPAHCGAGAASWRRAQAEHPTRRPSRTRARRARFCQAVTQAISEKIARCDAHALAHPSASPYEPADRLMDRSKANKFKGWGSAAAALRRCARRERSLSKLTAGWQRYIYTSINRCCNRATSSAANAAFQPIPRCAVVPHAPT